MSFLDGISNIAVYFPNIKDVNFHKKCSKRRAHSKEKRTTHSKENTSMLVPVVQHLTCKMLLFTC